MTIDAINAYITNEETKTRFEGDKFTGSNIVTLDDGTFWTRDYHSEMICFEDKFYRGLNKTNKKWWQFWKPEYVYSGVSAYGTNPLEID